MTVFRRGSNDMTEQQQGQEDITNRVLLTRLEDLVRQNLNNQGRILARLDLVYEQMSQLIGEVARIAVLPSKEGEEEKQGGSGTRYLLGIAITVSLAAISGIITLVVLLVTHILSAH